ncbi:MAG: hypothetical protein SFX72_13055 [Isosphaeraceae bacterium]|nr:hypothetical protein [Isosphaeraceae bacterium]
MTRAIIFGVLCAIATIVASDSASAQSASADPAAPVRGVYQAPGYYGTSWGVASYGVPRTYSRFSSPYGAGYAQGYAPYGILPGPYGTGLWRQSSTAPGYAYGSPAYSTYARPFRQYDAKPGPPIGAYAPAFGPYLPPVMIGH